MTVYGICTKKSLDTYLVKNDYLVKKDDYYCNITVFTFPVVRYFCGKGKGRTRTDHEGPAEE